MRLLVGIDGRPGGRDAAELARVLAAEGEGRALLVNVLFTGPLPMEYALLEGEEADEARPLFEDALERLDGVPAETRAFGGGSPAGILTTVAESEDVDAIVVGSPHRGAIGRIVLGSVAKSLLDGAPCEVFVAPKGYADERQYPFREIAAAYDGTPESTAALRRAEELARLSNARLKVITVLTPPVAVPAPGGYAPPPPPVPADVLDQGLRSVDPRIGVEGVSLDGSPARMISEACEDGVDLLVLGSRGYGPLARVLLGSVSRQVLPHAPCPVLVVARP